ncbi:hypothetical protein cyc_03317 [Cyclospora cayetanensis]|uniref:Uncharacterized protein n=1 Tax=Cyclospora cayetanensis TaxID=88456 RepID=A0A1D3CVK5_9EIME|nr:hypothetical protein cyc_03317 [Cyclospora cayetanensis]
MQQQKLTEENLQLKEQLKELGFATEALGKLQEEGEQQAAKLSSVCGFLETREAFFSALLALRRKMHDSTSSAMQRLVEQQLPVCMRGGCGFFSRAQECTEKIAVLKTKTASLDAERASILTALEQLQKEFPEAESVVSREEAAARVARLRCLLQHKKNLRRLRANCPKDRDELLYQSLDGETRLYEQLLQILKQETREEIEDEEKREDDEKRESLDVSDIQPGRGEVASSAFEEKRLEQADVEPPSGESEEEVLTPRSVANAAFSAATGEESGVAESDIAAAADCGECLSESTPHSLAAAELAAASASGEEAGNAGKSSRSLSPRGDANAVAAEAGVVASMHRGEQMSQGCGEEHAAADSGPLSEPLLQQRAKQMLAADDEGEAETSTEETATGIVGKLRRLHIPQDDAGVYGGGDGASASQSAESTGTVDVERQLQQQEETQTRAAGSLFAGLALKASSVLSCSLEDGKAVAFENATEQQAEGLLS